jgi:hypothetical protein
VLDNRNKHGGRECHRIAMRVAKLVVFVVSGTLSGVPGRTAA